MNINLAFSMIFWVLSITICSMMGIGLGLEVLSSQNIK